jgi:hypothetical protein
MSHRVTFSSEIKDPELAIRALSASKMTYQQYQEGGASMIRITSGPLTHATINLRTGEVISDSDIHRKDELGALRQAYSEAEFKRDAQRRGVQIESESIVEHAGVKGVVKISCYASTMTA